MTAKRKAALAIAKGHHHHRHHRHHRHHPHQEAFSPRVVVRLGCLVVFVVCSLKIICQNVNISLSQRVAGATNLMMMSVGNGQLSIDNPVQQYLRCSLKWGAPGGSESGAVEAHSTPDKERVHDIDTKEKINANAPRIDVEEIVPVVKKRADQDAPQIEVVMEKIDANAPQIDVEEIAPAVKKRADQDAPQIEVAIEKIGKDMFAVRDEAPDLAVKEQFTDTKEQIRSAPTILIAVVTTRSMLPVRVPALLKAWAGNVAENIVVHFFVGSDISNGKFGSIADIQALALEAGLEEESSLHVLRAADDEYPPVYKNTQMLKRADQIVMDFRESGNGQIDWIFKVDDVTYVNLETLPEFLESKDPTQHHFYGSQRNGRLADRDGLKKAGLEKPYCLGGPGFILSHTALHATAPTFKECVKKYDTSPWRKQIWHSDSIIGLCVQQQTGLGCWDGATEKDDRGKKAFYHVAVVSNLDAILQQKRQAAFQFISIHPINEPATMVALRIMFPGSDVAALTKHSSKTDSLSLSRKDPLPLSVAHQKPSFATDATDDGMIPPVLLLAAEKYPEKFQDRVKRIRNWHAIGADEVANKMIKKSIQEIKAMSLEEG